MDSSLAGRTVHGLARFVALAGGVALTVMVGVVVVSVIGRALIPIGLSSIHGDYELVEAFTGFAIFCFLPWAHLMRGHAVVAILTDTFSARINAWIIVATDALMFAAAVFLAWRHLLGTIDKYNYGETTLLLRMPLWWSYAAGLVGLASLVIVSAYVLVRSLTEATSANPPHPAHEVAH